jgi:prolipoprotein diacylglyceryltransferase
LVGVAILLQADKRFNLIWGKMFGLYLIYYSIGRVWVEAIRIDPSEIVLGLRVNIWSAILGMIVGLAVILIQSRRHTGSETSAYLAGRAPKIASESDEATGDKLVSEK